MRSTLFEVVFLMFFKLEAKLLDKPPELEELKELEDELLNSFFSLILFVALLNVERL